MFRKLLVPLDGSHRAEMALPFAARIAQHTGATILLVRAVSSFSEDWPTATTMYPSLVQTVVDADMADASDYLEQVASSGRLAGISVKTIAQYGPPAPTILSIAALYESDLIILCSRGSASMIHWTTDSVAKKIARHSRVPVLVVSEESTHLDSTPADRARPLRLLVPLDGSARALAALEPGAALLSILAAPGQEIALHLTHVCKSFSCREGKAENVPQDDDELLRSKEALNITAEQIKIGEIAPFIADHHIPVTWSTVREVDVAGALVRIAEQGEEPEGTGTFGGCELIAMSTHGRSGLQRWMLGSISERVLPATRRPVLIVHSPEIVRWKELMRSEKERALSTLAHSS